MGAKQFSQKGGNRHYRGPAMSGAFQGVHSVQLMQKELGLSFSNAGYWLGTLNQFISSDSQLTHLQNGGNNSAFAIGLEWDSPHKTLNGSDTFQELQSDSFFFFNCY